MQQIESPDCSELASLCQQLADHARELDLDPAWPQASMDLCGQAGVYRWFHDRRWKGFQWSQSDVIRGYLALSSACLTTTFVITQRTGACQRIERSDNEDLKAELLPKLVSGEIFATVGISHLTTSRQHLSRPVLRATLDESTITLDGYSPWVTGVPQADYVVTGATLDDGRQILLALPTHLDGIEIPKTPALVGLTASQTGELRCNQVRVPRRYLLYGPIENVMQQGAGGNTGGLQTSTLALGLADAALCYLEAQSEGRAELLPPGQALREEWSAAVDDLLAMADGQERRTNEDLRGEAGRLAVNASQAALTAAKGAGYVAGHPTGRWCREALFFLVWSCPQSVAQARLCELAGLA